MTAWYEDESFWIRFAPVLFNEERWGAAAYEAEQAIALLDLPAGGSILDACCGVGRHSIEFARRAMRVTGVDRMAPFLEAARDTAESEGFDIELVHADARVFRRPDAFDGAVNLFTSMGYLESLEQEKRVLRNIRDSLRSGGRFLVDLIGREIVAMHFRPTDWYEDDNGLMLSEFRVTEDWSRLENHWILIGAEGTVEYTFSHRLFSAG